MKELAFNGLLAIAIVFYLIHATLIAQHSLPSDVVEANGFPLLIGVISLCLLGVNTWETFKRRREEEKISLSKSAMVRIGVILAAIVFYIQLLPTLGFITSMFIFLLASITAAGSKRYVMNLLFAVVTVVALTLIFGQVFMISLPRGTGLFFNLSFLLH